MPDPVDPAPLMRAVAGDDAAFAQLVAPYQGPVFRHCYRMLGSGADAEDATQDTLERAWRKLATYDGSGPFGAWLQRIATNVCLDGLRAQADPDRPGGLRAGPQRSSAHPPWPPFSPNTPAECSLPWSAGSPGPSGLRRREPASPTSSLWPWARSPPSTVSPTPNGSGSSTRSCSRAELARGHTANLRCGGQYRAVEVALGGPRSRAGGHRARIQRLTAVRAGRHGRHDMPASRVPGLQGRAVGGGPPVAPLAHGHHHVPQVAALFGEPVLRARRMITVGDAREDPVFDEAVQPLGEDVAGDAQARLEIVKAGHPEECVPDDEQAPPLAHDIEALGDRAGHVLEAGPLHEPSIEGCVIERINPRVGSMKKLMRRREVSWEDPMVGATLALDLSGLDYLRAIAEGRVPPPPIAVLLGMGIAEVQPGRVTFSLEVGEHLYNPIGSVHGGVFCTLLDSAMACAVHSTLDRGQAYTTLELKVNLVRALTAGTPRVLATGQVISTGRRVATASGQITGPDGTLYAHATTTCLVFEPHQQAQSAGNGDGR